MTQIAQRHAHYTVEQAQINLRGRFKEADIYTYELDARVLTGFALSLDDIGLIKHASRGVTEQENKILEKVCLARLEGKPVSRIIGVKEFYSLPFHISTATLDPRPESECLVDSALNAAEKLAKSKSKPLRVLDLGTGLGVCLLRLPMPASKELFRSKDLG